MAPRILFFLPDVRPGGVAVALRNAVNYLACKGWHITVAGDNTEMLALDERVSVVPRNGLTKWRLACTVLSTHYDAAIGVQPHNAYWLILASRIRRERSAVVSWEHSSPVTSLRQEYPRAWRLHLALKIISTYLADRIFCVSRGAVDELKAIPLTRGAGIFYCPNIVFDGKALTRTPRQHQPREEKEPRFTFASIGRLSREKGLDIALAALRRLGEYDWRYVIVGDGPEKVRLMQTVTGDPLLRQRVSFEPWTNDLASIFSRADCLLLPSRFEGMPTVLIEASIHGVPIIAADCKTGPREIVRPGLNGYLFTVGDSCGMHSVIAHFCSRADAIESSAEFVADFERESAGTTLMRLLEELSAERIRSAGC